MPGPRFLGAEGAGPSQEYLRTVRFFYGYDQNLPAGWRSWDRRPDAPAGLHPALQAAGLSPEEELEAASYLLFSKGDYRVAIPASCLFTALGLFQKELAGADDQAFYLPNVEALRRQYEENCTLLSRYPYLFRRDFLPFEDLPIQFYPYDDDGYLPFDWKSGLFSDYVNFHTPVIDRNFFHEFLEKPVLASDVYSQYQLEYLNDTVRKSEWVGRENHIYLHYTDWGTFCAHLQCLSFKKLLKEEKLVFLIEDELAQYPIDFQARFHIDYSRYPVRPVGIREVNRLIWHTQLAAPQRRRFLQRDILWTPEPVGL